MKTFFPTASQCLRPLALAILALAAHGAQASMTVYGAVDSFLQYSNNSGDTALRLQSGGASTSRWGITGSEDLGAGVYSGFKLEGGINLMNGQQQSATSMFNREANLWIGSERWGRLKLGKQYPAIPPEGADPFYAVGMLSPWASAVLAVGDLGPGATTVQARVDNAVSYQTPTYNGLSATVLYALRNEAGASPVARNVGGLVDYANGPLDLTVSYNAIWADTPHGKAPGTPDGPRTDLVMASALYQFGALGASATFTLTRPTAINTYVASVYSLGAVWSQGPHAVRAGAIYRNVSGREDSAFGLLLGYDYQFSKLTGLYARVGGFRNQGQSQLSFGSDPLASPGLNPLVVALGLRKKF
ncbi:MULTISPECIES: porin [unclassified Paraburkholderia]|uniref:porin n=1 Tax=unclassified Paraburkholderia TaxID=2615204 RepID=UPI002AB72415|nr:MULTISPECIES: porin [unclassified Paraburkholderia]